MTGISYEEAVSTLTAMFSESWTQQQLETVLRHFEGHMENTVDAILGHGDGNPDALIARLSNKVDVSMDEEIARQLSEDNTNTRSKVSRGQYYPGSNLVRSPPAPAPSAAPQITTTPKKKGIGTPTTLPPDFLRVPGRKYDNTMSEDEALARMLQDELFTAEIANNPEFAHLARGRLPHSSAIGGPGSTAATSAQGPNIMDQISNLGNQAKLKLAELANQWNAKQNNAGTANEARTETRGLLDDREDDDDIAFAGGGSGRNTVMEMSSFPGGGSKKDK